MGTHLRKEQPAMTDEMRKSTPKKADPQPEPDILELVRAYRKASAALRRSSDRRAQTNYFNAGIQTMVENRVRRAHERHDKTMHVAKTHLSELGATDVADLLTREHELRDPHFGYDKPKTELSRIAKAIKLATATHQQQAGTP